MKTATVFKNGYGAQAINIPKEYQLLTEEVWVKKVGDTLIIRPKQVSWEDFFNSPLKLSEDFSMKREG